MNKLIVWVVGFLFLSIVASAVLVLVCLPRITSSETSDQTTALVQSSSPDGMFRCTVTERTAHGGRYTTVIVEERKTSRSGDTTWAEIKRREFSGDSSLGSLAYSIDWSCDEKRGTTGLMVFGDSGTPPFAGEALWELALPFESQSQPAELSTRHATATSLGKHDLLARLLPDGSLRLKLYHDHEVVKQAVVPADRIGAANAVMATHFDKPGLGPWCVVECHVNPSTSMIVAWNPQTDTVYCSPGYAWAVNSGGKVHALVTILRPHFGTPADALDTVYVNEVELADMSACGWRDAESGAGGVVFKGTGPRGDPVLAKIVSGGRWTSPKGNAYDVFCLTLEGRTSDDPSAALGSHRVYFVRNGKVARSAICSGEITVRDNQLLELNRFGVSAAWPMAKVLTDGL